MLLCPSDVTRHKHKASELGVWKVYRGLFLQLKRIEEDTAGCSWGTDLDFCRGEGPTTEKRGVSHLLQLAEVGRATEKREVG